MDVRLKVTCTDVGLSIPGVKVTSVSSAAKPLFNVIVEVPPPDHAQVAPGSLSKPSTPVEEKEPGAVSVPLPVMLKFSFNPVNASASLPSGFESTDAIAHGLPSFKAFAAIC